MVAKAAPKPATTGKSISNLPARSFTLVPVMSIPAIKSDNLSIAVAIGAVSFTITF